jgi:PAS domain S-box-containing protein/diguanylate cyclase (GGDEF)-like protein
MGKLLQRYRKEMVFLLLLLTFLFSLSTYFAYKELKASVENIYLEKLTNIKFVIKEHIEDHFRNRGDLLLSIASGGTVKEAFKEFKDGFQKVEHEFHEDIDRDRFLDKVEYLRENIAYQIPNSVEKREVEKFFPEGKSGEILQNLYIANNPFGATDRYRLFSSRKNITYDKAHKKYHGYFLNELQRYGFYDIFLLDLNGNIIYTVYKEHDFGTDIKDGIFSNSHFADLYKKSLKLSKNKIAFEDFKPYEPSYNRPASFLATPIFENGEKIGVIAVQLSMKKIDLFLKENSYFGESGEAYLVGDDFLMRSSSRFISQIENPLVEKFLTTIGVIPVKSDGVYKALSGISGKNIFTDYRDIEVFSSFSPIEVCDKRWAILVEIDRGEVVSQVEDSIENIVAKNIFITLLIGVIVWYLFYLFVLKPIENRTLKVERLEQRRTVALKSSYTFLKEYKRAVDESSIVSKGDLKGDITYVNDAFCRISGYSRDELIGQSHNIVRHPDMKDEVFADLWNTVTQKRYWKGIIKNRKKDGEAYYVSTTIVPILNDDGEIREYISIRNEVTELFEKDQQILQQTTDGITGLPNREKLLDDLSKNSSMDLAILRVSGVKDINDFYGVETGKTLLLNVGRTLQRMIDENRTTLYRIGEDEFATLFKSGEESLDFDFKERVENIAKYFNHNVIVVDDNQFNFSINVGCSKGGGKDIFINAEMALRMAKQNSKDVVFFDDSLELEKSFKNNIEMTTKIKRAINSNRIVLFAQAIESSSGKSRDKKYECLVRMVDCNGEIISPYFFLNIAKKARLYPTITKIVIEKSMNYFKDKRGEFSINLSIDDILDEDIVNFLKKMLIKYRIGDRVILEIVESEGIENFDDISRFVEDIRKFGCRIAIDDFGTGYSNFEYLSRLNVDFIKIDGSLIKNLDRDDNSRLIVELIVSFAKRKGISTVAEFVHNRAVFEIVKSMGIEYLQGYYLGKPELLEEGR